MNAIMDRAARMLPGHIKDHVKGRLAALRADRRGSVAIEFALVLPFLMGLLLGGVTVFDMYRFAERTESTTYTIADLIARRDFVDRQNLDDLHATHVALLGGEVKDVRTRISSVVKREVKNGRSKGNGKGKKKYELVVEWTYDSRNVNGCKPATDVPLELVPEIAENDSVVIVETHAEKDLFTDRVTGSQDGSFSNNAVARPRYVSAIGLKPC